MTMSMVILTCTLLGFFLLGRHFVWKLRVAGHHQGPFPNLGLGSGCGSGCVINFGAVCILHGALTSNGSREPKPRFGKLPTAVTQGCTTLNKLPIVTILKAKYSKILKQIFLSDSASWNKQNNILWHLNFLFLLNFLIVSRLLFELCPSQGKTPLIESVLEKGSKIGPFWGA